MISSRKPNCRANVRVRERTLTIEELADMHPEQLEAIPGIGPKTMEKIFYTINNYFSGLEAAEGGETTDVEAAPLDQSEAGVSEDQTELASPDQSDPSSSDVPEAVSEQAPESSDEPVESGQNLEASIISGGVESAPPTDEEKANTDEAHPGEDHTTPEK